jgi:hypothetical protein
MRVVGVESCVVFYQYVVFFFRLFFRFTADCGRLRDTENKNFAGPMLSMLSADSFVVLFIRIGMALD